MRSSLYDKALFFCAAAFNLGTAAILLLRPDIVMTRLGIIDPAAKLLTRSLASSVTAWGIAYLLVMINPARFREFVRLGVFSKTLFFLIYAAAFCGGQIFFPSFAPAIIDLIFALLFVEYLFRTQSVLTRGKN